MPSFVSFARRLPLASSALVACAVVLALPQPVQAQSDRTGVVLRFSGSRGSAARSAVIRAIDERINLMGRAEVEDNARNTGATLDEAPGMASVAREMGLSLFVSGRVRGRGSRGRTEIRIHDAIGNEVAMREGPAPIGRARLGRIGRAASEALDQALEAISAREAQEQREREEADAAAAAAAAAQRQTWEAEEAEEEDEEATEGGLPRFVGLLGFDGRTRDAALDLLGGGGRDYDSGTFGVLTLQLSSYPMGDRAGAIRGIYAQVDFGVSLGLKSQEQLSDGSFGPVLSTTAMQFLLHVGYLYPIGDDDARIGAMLGFGLDSFSLGDNSSMSSSKYTFLRIGLAGDVRVYEELLRARVDVGYRLTFGVGDLTPTFGEDASANGFDIGLSLLATLEMGIVVGARFGFTRYGVSFTGAGASPADRPAGADGDSMTDKALNFGVQVGYALQ